MMVRIIAVLSMVIPGAAMIFSSDEFLNIPSVTLNNGVKMPMVGLGTWEYNTSTAFEASLKALKAGYVHIDTAQIYDNQKGVGYAIREFQNGGGDRRDFFITTKINGGLTEEEAWDAMNQDLEDLQVDYVDLMLVHFPANWNGTGGLELRVQGWKAMERFYRAGKARAIGVSHFCQQHIQDILDHGTLVPQVNQVEYHVGMGSSGPLANDYRDFDRKHNIVFQSFSPLCGPCNTTELIDGKMVSDIGKKYNKSGVQVSLKWLVQQGIPVIPKTTSLRHMMMNADLFDFELSKEDMDTLTKAKHPSVSGGGADGTSGDCKIQ